jgi:hypothetical protein
VFARVSSFTDLARVVQAGHAAAVLPDLAAVDFDTKRFTHEPIDDLKPRSLAKIWTCSKEGVRYNGWRN